MIKPKKIPFTVAEMNRIFEERTPGVLWRREGRSTHKPAGTTMKRGYCQIKIEDKFYLRHRLIWYMQTGTQPDVLDHVYGLEKGDAIGNLQILNHSKNQWKQRQHKNNSSGYVGVYWRSRSKSWVAQIQKNGVRHHLGYFDDPKDAGDAYLEAKKTFHKGQKTLR